jgi:hypothetical protein
MTVVTFLDGLPRSFYHGLKSNVLPHVSNNGELVREQRELWRVRERLKTMPGVCVCDYSTEVGVQRNCASRVIGRKNGLFLLR